MGSVANRIRGNWQTKSGAKALSAEDNIELVFNNIFKDTEYSIRRKPKELNNIYKDVKLSEQVLSEIYIPTEKINKHGLQLDFAIDNNRTKKTIYIDSKRQDGWVEGKSRQDGRGNAHERICKYFSPGLQKILRKFGNLGDNITPFCAIFQGDITRDVCRNKEIETWFYECEEHFFMWTNTEDKDALIEYFNKSIKPLLDQIG